MPAGLCSLSAICILGIGTLVSTLVFDPAGEAIWPSSEQFGVGWRAIVAIREQNKTQPPSARTLARQATCTSVSLVLFVLIPSTSPWLTFQKVGGVV
jgi:hypothetical protein